MIANPTLPIGWTSEDWGDGCQAIVAPGISGAVTIDWTARGYRRGCTSHGRLDSTVTYAGRGWKQRLLADAIQALAAP